MNYSVSDHNSVLKLPYECFYSHESQTLYCRHNAGFFSNCSVTLWGIIELLKKGILPQKIDFSQEFSPYKNEQEEQRDIYDELFQMNDNLNLDHLPSLNVKRFDQHGIYKNYNFVHYKPLLEKYFQIQPSILNIERSLIEKYNLNLQKIITVVYRGRLASSKNKQELQELLLHK